MVRSGAVYLKKHCESARSQNARGNRCGKWLRHKSRLAVWSGGTKAQFWDVRLKLNLALSEWTIKPAWAEGIFHYQQDH